MPISYTDMGSKNSITSYCEKLGLGTTPNLQPYNIGWMKDGQELRMTC